MTTRSAGCTPIFLPKMHAATKLAMQVRIPPPAPQASHFTGRGVRGTPRPQEGDPPPRRLTRPRRPLPLYGTFSTEDRALAATPKRGRRSRNWDGSGTRTPRRRAILRITRERTPKITIVLPGGRSRGPADIEAAGDRRRCGTPGPGAHLGLPGPGRGKPPRSSAPARKQRELARTAATSECTIADPAEVFTVSRAPSTAPSSDPRQQDRPGNQTGRHLAPRNSRKGSGRHSERYR